MTLESEAWSFPDQGSDKFDLVLKKQRISYSRDVLLSLSNLDICKKLPIGFDESLLCEFEDVMQSIQDRPRIPGSLSLQGFRRNDSGSSPPTRGDSGNYSRGTYGKWESRSSGRSDRDTDSQFDRDSDSGRRYGHQSRQSRQTTEQDGLLGNGSFPRQHGYTAGISGPKVGANEHYQLSKSNELYHPPRPYKAVPYSRRDSDAFNDKTFGSTEWNNEDNEEEERRRRVSFELMRKEQQKALQEKQHLNLEIHKPSDVSNLFEVLGAKKEEEISAATPNLSNDLEKSSFASHSLATRPLVPPGFKNNILEKSFGLKSLIHHPLLEEGKPVKGESLFDAEVNFVQNGIDDGLDWRLSEQISLVDHQHTGKTTLLDKGENVNLRGSLDVPIRKPAMEDQLPHASSHLDKHRTLDDPEIVGVLEEKTVGDSKRSFSTSFLGKIFGSTLSMNDAGSGSAEHHDSKRDDTWKPTSPPSSKFAQWSSEEEAKPADNISSGRPNDLLSLIVGGDKGRYQVSESEAAEQFLRDFSFNTLEQSENLTFDLASEANGIPDQAAVGNKNENIPTVLTCEDLEQSILTEYSAKTANIEPFSKGWSTDANAEQLSEHDDHASLHLLSLLQKGTDQSMTPTNVVEINLPDKPVVPQNHMGTAVNEPKGEENGNNILMSGKAVTLEALFGSAFMKELQSVEAPVSIQRGSTGSAEVDALEPHGLSSAMDKIGLKGPSHDHRFLSSNYFDDSQVGSTSTKHYSKELIKHGGFEGVFEFQMPDENVKSVADHRNHQMSTFKPTHNSTNSVNYSTNAPIDIMDKLTAITAVGSDSLPFIPGRYQDMEPELPYRSQVQQTSPQQMAQARPLYNHLDSHLTHMSSQMKFFHPEPIFNHESPPNHQFPSNTIRHPFYQPNIGVAGFDVPSRQSMVHQRPISINQAPHLLSNFPSGAPVAHHGNQATSFIQERNQKQGFTLGARQPNIGSHGLPVPAPQDNPPEALQRLIEMELQANSKIHPLASAPNQGIYGPEVDMGFRYR